MKIFCKRKNKTAKEPVIKKSLKEVYDERFYLRQRDRSYLSAKKVLAKLNSIYTDISSVMDVGCGVGTWLKVWQEINPQCQILGLDANELPEEKLCIKRANLKIADFSNLDKSLVQNKKFDLVESLEVAEHIPEENAKEFIDFLTRYADIVLFSAAAKNQPGDCHVNTQYADYWNEIFKEKGFKCFDILRSELWEDKEICWWYRQNITIYAKGKAKTKLENLGYKFSEHMNTYYHPEFIEQLIGETK